jgi:hypothetical protein
LQKKNPPANENYLLNKKLKIMSETWKINKKYFAKKKPSSKWKKKSILIIKNHVWDIKNEWKNILQKKNPPANENFFLKKKLKIMSETWKIILVIKNNSYFFMSETWKIRRFVLGFFNTQLSFKIKGF